MSHAQLPIESLPPWLILNDVSFLDVRLASIPEKGYGLVAERKLATTEETFDIPSLLSIPHDLVLNAEAVEQYAKEDRNFRQLLDVVGHKSTRLDIMLFLLVQLVLGSRTAAGEGLAGLSNPWTEYVKFLPGQVPLPTLWTELERSLLRGTSLESAVNAKLLALEQEFDRLQELSSDIPCWQATFWDSKAVNLNHWFLLDAWYRSRCLELPGSGESMVPCLDMVNHSSIPNAYYEESGKDQSVVLLLRPKCEVSSGDEITISYGDQKSPAEMLFSYGFIDPESTHDSLVLPLEPFPDDPLGKAKLHIFGAAPTVTVRRRDGEDAIRWDSPFASLMCVNEEDGLEFRLLQETSGERQLRVFWQGSDVTGSAGDFESLLRSHEDAKVFQLRVVTVVREIVESHLDRMRSTATLADLSLGQGTDLIRDGCAHEAFVLREAETRIIGHVLEALEAQQSQLLADERVVAYMATAALGSKEMPENDLADEAASNEDEDFS